MEVRLNFSTFIVVPFSNISAGSTQTNHMKFLLVDDHKVVREGLRNIILSAYPHAGIVEAGAAEELNNILNGENFDAVISDFSLPGRNGLDVIKQVHSENPKTPVLILSMHPEQQYALRVLKAGAAGYINKTSGAEELLVAISKVLSGRQYFTATMAEQLANEINSHHTASHEILSDREFTVFKMISEGRSLSSIAADLNLSLSTVSTHRTRILKKLHMSSNADLVKYAIEHELLS